ncbi:hypothetical protein BDN72DRAFT_899880 [Pluteus cervinus]|uniref:Uncharacterized protein n=1 Tax=Pluteus cervinus TaxID=181527 RepID=A0ACD3AL76_9AGAR|nr:hypothetical protein BDN72DRAFT_899880 [Pluteus cervinus]
MIFDTYKKPFPSLTGYYWGMYFVFEPLSLLGPLFTVFFDKSKGTSWFYNELVPLNDNPGPLHDRSIMVVWQLVNSYVLLACALTIAYTNIRDLTTRDLVSQEKRVGFILALLSLGDITHLLATVVALPEHLRFDPGAWNGMLHGQINFVIVLLVGRLAWFLGIGRQSYYFTAKQATPGRSGQKA